MKRLLFLLLLIIPFSLFSQDIKKVDGVTDTNIKKVSGVSDTNIKKVNGVTLSTFTGLLDDYPGAGVAYSVRKLDKDYIGSCIRIRRSSDNTEQDIGFESDGDLDVGAITTFCGAGNGDVVTIYDQSGNSYNLTVAPGNWRICTSGSITVADNGKPAITSISSTPFTASISMVNVFGSSVFYHYGVASATDLSTGGTLYFIDASTDYLYTLGNGFFGFFRLNYTLLCYNDGTFVDDQTYITEVLMQSSSSIDMYIDNTESGNNESVTTNAPTGTVTIYVGSDEFATLGTFQELVMYPSNQNSNRSSIYTNVSAYF